MSALRALVEGRLHFPSELLSPSEVEWPAAENDAPPRAIRLTPRQKDVLHWILKGCTNHAIATALGISAETVKLHVSAIFRAYGVHSRTQLVLLCSRSPSVMAAPLMEDEDSHVAPASAGGMPQHAAAAPRENTA